jgi:hypothetical protein
LCLIDSILEELLGQIGLSTTFVLLALGTFFLSCFCFLVYDAFKTVNSDSWNSSCGNFCDLG